MPSPDIIHKISLDILRTFKLRIARKYQYYILITIALSGIAFLGLSSKHKLSYTNPYKFSGQENDQRTMMFYRPIHKRKKIKSPNTLYTDHMYMVTMTGSIERRARAQTIFDSLGLDIEYVRAVDFKAEQHNLNISQEIVEAMHTLKDVGCWLSMLRVWRDFIQKGYETAFIFEDDMDMPTDIHAHIRKGLEIVEAQKETFIDFWNETRKHNDWQVVFPGHCVYREGRKPPLDDIYPYLRVSTGPLCLHGYIVHRRGVEEFLARFNQTIEREIDQAIAHGTYFHYMYGYSFEPSVITQRIDLVNNSISINDKYFGAPIKSSLEYNRRLGQIYSTDDVIKMGL